MKRSLGASPCLVVSLLRNAQAGGTVESLLRPSPFWPCGLDRPLKASAARHSWLRAALAP